MHNHNALTINVHSNLMKKLERLEKELLRSTNKLERLIELNNKRIKNQNKE